ncbi:uncharacterized protein LOC135395090 [Ornithodoros turicata]|uniref:uncharacterized protein LOC135395090 n=1 Tax=Ornithodoros turicata TaxID=34597 RepID=UPI0031389655
MIYASLLFRRKLWDQLLRVMASVPYTIHSAVCLHQNLKRNEQDNSVAPINTQEATLPRYNPKLMNSIWGLYNRYAPHSFQKNCENTVAQLPKVRSFGLWDRLH